MKGYMVVRRGWQRGIAFALCAALAVAICGFVVMGLWNWLTPALFGWRSITFWQAIGLLLLSKILFGGFRGRSRGYGRGHWRRRMIERWEQMTPEERERFRAGMRGRGGRCHGHEPPPAATTA